MHNIDIKQKSKHILTIIGCILLITIIILIFWRNLKPTDTKNTLPEHNEQSEESSSIREQRTVKDSSATPATEEPAVFTAPVFDQYINRSISVTLSSGSVLSIGLDTEDGSAIYLDPRYDCTEDEIMLSEDDTSFGIYVTSTLPSDIEWSSDTMHVFNNEDCPKYSLITDRTYDTLVDASYNDPEHYGVRWKDSNNLMGSDGRDHTLLIRIIRFPDGFLMGCCKIEIKWDAASNKYYIDDMYESDAAYTDELTEDTREYLIENAFDFFCSDDKGQSTVVDEDLWNANKYWATVQKVSRPYFPRLFDAKGEVAVAGKYTNLDIFAVSFNYPGYGVVTVYYAPRRQLDGMRDTVPATEDLIPFGFDALHPETIDSLLVPSWQADEFFN